MTFREIDRDSTQIKLIASIFIYMIIVVNRAMEFALASREACKIKCLATFHLKAH